MSIVLTPVRYSNRPASGLERRQLTAQPTTGPFSSAAGGVYNCLVLLRHGAADNYLDFASKWDLAILGEFHRLAPASSPGSSAARTRRLNMSPPGTTQLYLAPINRSS